MSPAVSRYLSLLSRVNWHREGLDAVSEQLIDAGKALTADERLEVAMELHRRATALLTE